MHREPITQHSPTSQRTDWHGLYDNRRSVLRTQRNAKCLNALAFRLLGGGHRGIRYVQILLHQSTNISNRRSLRSRSNQSLEWQNKPVKHCTKRLVVVVVLVQHPIRNCIYFVSLYILYGTFTHKRYNYFSDTMTFTTFVLYTFSSFVGLSISSILQLPTEIRQNIKRSTSLLTRF